MTNPVPTTCRGDGSPELAAGRHPSWGGPASWAPQGAVHVFSCRQGAVNKTKAVISDSICKPVFTYIGDYLIILQDAFERYCPSNTT